MSRLAKRPIVLGKGVELIERPSEKGGVLVSSKGPKGELELEMSPGFSLRREGEEIYIDAEEGADPALHGLYCALLSNQCKGVSVGFSSEIRLVGTGYRAIVQPKALELHLGYSKPRLLDIPQGITVKESDKGTKLEIQGIDKREVGQFVADIHRMRPVSPYSGKGVHCPGKHVRRKAVKGGKK